MSYSHLPVQERIRLASEYAVILNNIPVNTPENIVAELAQTFSLTNKEASEAYLVSKEKFSDHYKKATRSKSGYYAAVVFICICIGLFYLGVALQTGSLFFLVFALIFLSGIWLIIQIILKSVTDIFLLKYPHLEILRKKFIVRIFPVVLAIWLFLLYQSRFSGIIKEKDITVRPCTISSQVIRSKADGIFQEQYYEFMAVEYLKKFRFCQSDYKYAYNLPNLEKYGPGDTVYVELLKEDIRNIHKESFFSKYNRVIGMQLNGKSIINYDLRFETTRQKFKYWLNIATIILLINSLLIYILIRDIRGRMSIV